MVCDGRSLEERNRPALFAAIGRAYGGDAAAATFCLPDARGRVLAAQDGMTPAGTHMGSTSTTITIDQLPSHTHIGQVFPSGAHTHAFNEGVGEDMAVMVDETPDAAKTAWVRRGTTTASTSTAEAHTHDVTIQSMGSGQPVSLVQPTLVLGGAMIYAGPVPS
jgi:microcystin-dependent protein